MFSGDACFRTDSIHQPTDKLADENRHVDGAVLRLVESGFVTDTSVVGTGPTGPNINLLAKQQSYKQNDSTSIFL